jgi:hypothetical protein
LIALELDSQLAELENRRVWKSGLPSHLHENENDHPDCKPPSIAWLPQYFAGALQAMIWAGEPLVFDLLNDLGHFFLHVWMIRGELPQVRELLQSILLSMMLRYPPMGLSVVCTRI